MRTYLEAGLDFSRGVATRSPLAVANAEFVLNTAWSDGTGMESALRLERERTAYYSLHGTQLPRGLSAFRDKRRPVFRGNDAQ